MVQINSFKVGVPVFHWAYTGAYESVTIDLNLIAFQLKHQETPETLETLIPKCVI